MIRKTLKTEKQEEPYWVGRRVVYTEWVRIPAKSKSEAVMRVKNGEGNWTGQMEFHRILHADSWNVEPEEESNAQ